jgi:hypothetical protein
MKLGALRKDDKQTLRQIPSADVAVLWVTDYYDGPISGVAEVAGARHLFEMIDRDLLGREEEPREFWLIALDERQLEEETRWHELFCRNVGTHFDYTGRSPLPPGEVDMEAFCEPYKRRVPPDYQENDVVGWFRL